MSLASVTGIFAGATVSSGDITIPSGTIVSFTPVSTTNPGGYELVFGLCESMHRKVGTTYNNMSSTVSQQLVDGGASLRRIYTFTVDLSLASGDIASLNVKPTG